MLGLQHFIQNLRGVQTGLINFNSYFVSGFAKCVHWARAGWRELSNLPKIVVITSVFINLLSLGLPLTILQVYDRVIPNQSYDTLFFLMLGLGAMVLIECCLKIMRAYFLAHEASRFGFLSEVNMIRDLLRAPSFEIERTPATIWLGRLESYVQHNKYQAGQLRLIALDLPFAILFLGLIWVIAGPLVLVPLVLIAAFAIFVLSWGRSVKALIHKQIQENSKKYDFITEVLGGIHTVKSIATEPQMQRRFERLQKTCTALSYDVLSQSGVLATASAMANLLTITGILTVGAYLIIQDVMTVGALACCTLLATRIMRPIIQGMAAWTDIQNVLALKERIKPLQTLQKSLSTPHESEPNDVAHPNVIDVQNLTYKTEKDDVLILNNLTFSIAWGEIICFYGPNDAGKTTLFKCLSGDIKDYGGSVYFNGRYELSNAPESVTDTISYVTSTMPGYQGTLLDNLTMFRTDISSDAVHRVSKLIGLEAQINLLPDGYYTKIGGYNDTHLPSGLIQKVAIARALLSNPEVLILDEVTARLDGNEKQILYKALEALKGNLTLIIATNDQEMIKISDRSFLIENGTVASHENMQTVAS